MLPICAVLIRQPKPASRRMFAVSMRQVWLTVSGHAAGKDLQLQSLVKLDRSLPPMAGLPHLGIGISSESTRIPFAMRSMDQHAPRQHGPPKQPTLHPGPKPSEAHGAHPPTMGSAAVEAEADLSGLARHGTAITVEASEASPHCFLVCVSCGLERSLLLPMAAHDFQAAMGSFASTHRACHR